MMARISPFWVKTVRYFNFLVANFLARGEVYWLLCYGSESIKINSLYFASQLSTQVSIVQIRQINGSHLATGLEVGRSSCLHYLVFKIKL